MNENIKPIPNYPGYYAGVDGSIWSEIPCRMFGKDKMDKFRKLKPCVNGSGYRIVTLCVNKKRYSKKVCRLILNTFVGEQPSMMACHGANGKLDDSLLNLEWGDGKKNQLDRKRDGTDCANDKHPMARLTKVDVQAIRKLRGIFTQSQIGAMYNTSQVNISRIHLNKAWRGI